MTEKDHLKQFQANFERYSLANDALKKSEERVKTNNTIVGAISQVVPKSELETIASTYQQENENYKLVDETRKLFRKSLIRGLEDKLDSVLSSIDDKKLAQSSLLLVEPYEIANDKKHNERARLHREAREYVLASRTEEGLKKLLSKDKVQNELENKIREEIKKEYEELQKQTAKNITDYILEKNKEDKMLFDEKDVQEYAEAISPIIANRKFDVSKYKNKEYQMELLSELIRDKIEAYEKSFANESEMANYAREGLKREYKSLEDKNKDSFAEKIYIISKQESTKG